MLNVAPFPKIIGLLSDYFGSFPSWEAELILFGMQIPLDLVLSFRLTVLLPKPPSNRLTECLTPGP